MTIFSLKRKAHRFVNMAFYFIFFIIGFIVGGGNIEKISSIINYFFS